MTSLVSLMGILLSLPQYRGVKLFPLNHSEHVCLLSVGVGRCGSVIRLEYYIHEDTRSSVGQYIEHRSDSIVDGEFGND